MVRAEPTGTADLPAPAPTRKHASRSAGSAADVIDGDTIGLYVTFWTLTGKGVECQDCTHPPQPTQEQEQEQAAPTPYRLPLVGISVHLYGRSQGTVHCIG